MKRQNLRLDSSQLELEKLESKLIQIVKMKSNLKYLSQVSKMEIGAVQSQHK